MLLKNDTVLLGREGGMNMKRKIASSAIIVLVLVFFLGLVYIRTAEKQTNAGEKKLVGILTNL